LSCLCIGCIFSYSCGLQFALLDPEGLGPGEVIHHVVSEFFGQFKAEEIYQMDDEAFLDTFLNQKRLEE
jgi:hypothetical protein